MADNPLFELDAEGRWRLAFDGRQWIIQRRDGRRTWRGIVFIGDKKSTLWRMFRERKIWLTVEAIAKVDALPDHYFNFLRRHDPELGKRHPIYLAHQAAGKTHTARSCMSEQPGAREPENEPNEYSTAAGEALESNPDHTNEAPGTDKKGVDLDGTS